MVDWLPTSCTFAPNQGAASSRRVRRSRQTPSKTEPTFGGNAVGAERRGGHRARQMTNALPGKVFADRLGSRNYGVRSIGCVPIVTARFLTAHSLPVTVVHCVYGEVLNVAAPAVFHTISSVTPLAETRLQV